MDLSFIARKLSDFGKAPYPMESNPGPQAAVSGGRRWPLRPRELITTPVTSTLPDVSFQGHGFWSIHGEATVHDEHFSIESYWVTETN